MGKVRVGGKPTSEFDDVLRQLDKEYRKNAPRIKSMRERVIEFEPEKVIESDA